MTKPDIRKVIYAVNQEVSTEISNEPPGHRGEGYRGGYRDALSDVLLYLNGTHPSDSRYYWSRALAKLRKDKE